MRGGTSKGLYFLAGDLPRRPGRARRPAAAGHGVARPAADRRGRRRAPADLQGRGRVAVGGRRHRRRLPVPAGHGRPAGRHRQAELRQHPGRGRAVRGRARPGGGAAASETQGAHPDGEHRRDRHRDVPHPGRQAALRRARPRSTACPARRRRSCSTSRTPAPGASVFPTGNVTDTFGGITVTCVDNGMPVVVAAASSFGKSGQESVAELEGDEELNRRVQELRLAAGKAMGLGDVSATTVPKISLVAPPAARRDDRHPHLHPGPGARVDRGARRGQRRHRDHGPRRGRQRPGGASPRAARGWRSSTRAAPSSVEVELDVSDDAADRDPLGRRPHRPQAVRRHRLPPVAAPRRWIPGADPSG